MGGARFGLAMLSSYMVVLLYTVHTRVALGRGVID